MPSRNTGRTIWAVILSLLTIVGGHFVNRRWDRALLFLALIPVVLVGAYIWFLVSVNMASGGPRSVDIGALFSRIVHVSSYVLMSVYALSVVITYWDARAHTEDSSRPWTATGKLAAVLTSVASFALVLYVLLMVGVSHLGKSGLSFTSNSFERQMLINVHFGGLKYGMPLVAPPTGGGHLNLRFSYAGKPAVGLAFKLKLDGKYKSQMLVTNAQGIASLSLPVGEAYLNELNITGWDHAPAGDRDVVIRTGHEKHFSLRNYFKYPWGYTKGLAVSVSSDPKAVAMTFQIVPKIKMLWPSMQDRRTDVQPASGVIRWSPVAGANSYLLRFYRRQPQGRAYDEVLTRKVVGSPSFALARLPLVKSDDGAPMYTVDVKAFAADGAYLTESNPAFANGTFRLAGGMALAEEGSLSGMPQENFGGMPSDHDPFTSPLPAPPRGDGHLNLSFSYAGRPVTGLTIMAQLDGKYQTQPLVTDDQGIVRVPMPVGKAYLNDLTLMDWGQVPPSDSALEIRSGHEEKFSLRHYIKYPMFTGKGLAVTVSKDPKAIALSFQVLPKIKMLWPTRRDNKTEVRHETGAIRWSPVPGAKIYRLSITELKHEGIGTITQEVVVRKVVGRSSFALAQVPAVKSHDGTHVYSATVTAFAADGSYLAEAEEPYVNGTFVLADGLALAEDEYLPGGGPASFGYQPDDNSAFSETAYERRRKDKKRMDVIHGLIEDGKYDVAAQVLITVSEPSRKGGWYALQGLMLAKQHQCNQADQYLTKAEAYKGKGEDDGVCACYLKEARKLCPGR